MTEPVYDLVIRGGRVATVSDVFEADVAISGETIVAIGRALPGGRREIDARGKLVLPGGVDSHAHIEQLSAAGIMNADTFESATVSAAFGGTTTVIPFAAQHVSMKLPQVLEDYHALATRRCHRLRLSYDHRRSDEGNVGDGFAGADQAGPWLDQDFHDL